MSYIQKAKDSFVTKMNIFIFDRVIHDMNDFSLDDFKDYKIKTDLVDEYTTIYWQQETTFPLRNKTINEIWKGMEKIKQEKVAIIKECEEYYIKVTFPQIFPEQDYNTLIQADKCYYCEITKKEIETLSLYHQLKKKRERGWNLEIDRFDSNYEYTNDNCAMCCYWCNNAKTDEFTRDEFKEIAKEISKVWKNRIVKAMEVRFDERFGSPLPMTIIKKNDD